MAIRGINPNILHKYIPPSQREGGKPDGAPVERATVFYIRALPASELAKLEDKEVQAIMSGEDNMPAGFSMNTKMGTEKVEIIKKGLRGWDNMDMYADGQWVDAPYNKTGVRGEEPTEETITIIPPAERDGLCNAITELNNLNEDDVGK